MISTLPYVYFGGKRIVAPIVWKYLGNVKAYVEPFFGGGAVFWLRPQVHFNSDKRYELLNDMDGFIVNFLRAVHHDPEAVAHYADWHITETDLTARHLWLVHRKEDLLTNLESDPDYYDSKIAGWWVWGINNWIGGGWCSGRGGWTLEDGKIQKSPSNRVGVNKKKPLIGSNTHGILGVNKQKPLIGANAHSILGITKTKPAIGGNVRGILGLNHLVDYFDELSQRLRGNVCKIICGDWKRCVTPSCTIHTGIPVGVFLDPPYGSDRNTKVYSHDSTTVYQEVLEWCLDKGGDCNFRIALCGYTGYYDVLQEHGWYPYRWQAQGGYANANPSNQNKTREVVWFSPHCLHCPETAQHTLPLGV